MSIQITVEIKQRPAHYGQTEVDVDINSGVVGIAGLLLGLRQEK